MSAYMCDHDHIEYLVEAGRNRKIEAGIVRDAPTPENPWGIKVITDPQTIGQILWDENRRSIEHRYPDTQSGYNLPGPVSNGERSDEQYAYIHPKHSKYSGRPIDPVQLIVSCYCYEYQACEHDAWETSEAKRYIESLVHRAVRMLPGYDEAEWGAPKV